MVVLLLLAKSHLDRFVDELVFASLEQPPHFGILFDVLLYLGSLFGNT